MSRVLIACLLMLFTAPVQAQHNSFSFTRNHLGNIPSTVVASLPACNAGMNNFIYLVTNALTPSVGSTVAGGGAVTTLVHCNATNWIVG